MGKQTQPAYWRGMVVVGTVVVMIAFLLPQIRPTFHPQKTTLQLAEEQGFAIEVHHVRTADGYHLTMHRLPPHAPNTSVVANRGVILLQHGLLESSAIWVMRGKGAGLAFMLSSAGFDVWMGNNRGNGYARTHDAWSDDDERFWNFTMHEIAMYDFPALLQYVLQHTNASDLIYVGQSQGTSQALAALSMFPELQSRLRLLVALAPGVYLKPLPDHPFFNLIRDRSWLYSGVFGQHEFLWQFHIARSWMPETVLVWSGMSSFRWLGFTNKYLEEHLAPTLLMLVPSGGTSIYNMRHWVLAGQTGKFGRFAVSRYEDDHGILHEYDIAGLRVPLALFLAGNDTIVDNHRTVTELPHVYVHIQHDYCHADFLWSPDAPTEVYPKVLGLCEQYSARAPLSP